MNRIAEAVKRARWSPLLPFWLIVALLPFGRASELGTLLCTVGLLIVSAGGTRRFGHLPGAGLLLLLVGAYIAAALISAFGAVDPARSWRTVAVLPRFAMIGLFACWTITRQRRLEHLYVAVAAVLALWVADAWVQAFTGWSLGGPAQAERLTGIFGAGNPKFGPTLAVLAPFALWTAQRRCGRRGLAVAFLLLLGPVLLAGSRAAWLSYALVALAFAWRAAASPRRFAGYLGAGAVALALAGGIAWQASTRFEARMTRTLDALHGTSHGLDTALSGRLDIWRDSVRMIAAQPWNGVGVRGFRYAYPRFAPAHDHFLVAESCGVGEGACHAHQIVLEILTETGSVGLALWLAGAVIALRAWRRVGAAARERAFPASVALGVMVFPLNTHLAFYSAWWGLLFAWLLALWCAALYVAADD